MGSHFCWCPQEPHLMVWQLCALLMEVPRLSPHQQGFQFGAALLLFLLLVVCPCLHHCNWCYILQWCGTVYTWMTCFECYDKTPFTVVRTTSARAMLTACIMCINYNSYGKYSWHRYSIPVLVIWSLLFTLRFLCFVSNVIPSYKTLFSVS